MLKAQPKKLTPVDPLYREWISTLQCCTPGCQRHPPDVQIIPHHQQLKGQGSKAKKVSDYQCLPLCHEHHAELHQHGRWTFAKKYGIDFRILIIAYNRVYTKITGRVIPPLDWGVQSPATGQPKRL